MENELVLLELNKRVRELILAPDESEHATYHISGSRYNGLINYLQGVCDASRVQRENHD